MKRILTIMLTVGVLIGCNSDKVTQFTGVIKDASMNTVTVEDLNGDAVYVFSIENADKSAAYGLLLGNIIMVDYKGKLKEITPAIKVATDASYATAIGQWTMIDPINPDAKMGIDIMVDGDAASINMATKQYKEWELKGPTNEIILYGESIGNGQTIDFMEEAKLIEKDGKWWLVVDGMDWQFEKETI